MTTKLKILAFLTPALLLLDQATKLWTVHALRYSGGALPPKSPFSIQSPMDGLIALGHDRANPTELPIIPGFLSFIHAQNPGAAMGLMLGFEWRLPVFYAFTIVAVGVLVNMYRHLPDNDRLQSVTISLILSGAIGNFIDRLHKSTVTDFIRMYSDWPPLRDLLENSPLHSNEWPTYNIADAAIVVGVALYILHYLFFERDKEIGSAGKNPLDEPANG